LKQELYPEIAVIWALFLCFLAMGSRMSATAGNFYWSGRDDCGRVPDSPAGYRFSTETLGLWGCSSKSWAKVVADGFQIGSSEILLAPVNEGELG
jgi:hypothetical protein